MTEAGTPVVWGTAVVAGVAQQDIVEVVDPDDAGGAVFRTLWATARSKVAAVTVLAAQMATSTDPVPARRPGPVAAPSTAPSGAVDVATVAAALYPDGGHAALAGVVETMSRVGVAASNGLANGTLHLQQFTPNQPMTATNITFVTGTGQAGATLFKLGLYVVNDNGGYTLLTSFSDPTTANSSATVYTKPFATPQALVRGKRYAIGALIVGATTSPTIKGATVSVASMLRMAPTISQQVGSQTDLPATIAPTSATTTFVNYYRLT